MNGRRFTVSATKRRSPIISHSVLSASKSFSSPFPSLLHAIAFDARKEEVKEKENVENTKTKDYKVRKKETRLEPEVRDTFLSSCSRGAAPNEKKKMATLFRFSLVRHRPPAAPRAPIAVRGGFRVMRERQKVSAKRARR